VGIISVQSPTTGSSYSVRIAGDVPTAEEQQRIDAYLAQQDAAFARTASQLFPSVSAPAPEAPVEEDTGPDTSFRGAFASGIDQPLENIAETARLLGFGGTSEFLSGLTEAPRNYQSATEGFINEDGSLYDFGYLPRAAVEQSGQLLGSLATKFAGSVVGGAVGSLASPAGTVVGATVGGFAGPALFEGLQILGPVAQARAKNNGRDTPNSEDWIGALGTASVSGALNALAPNLSGFFKRVLVEGGTEGLQSLVQQAGETAATDVGLQIDPRQAGAEAILGGVTIGAIDAPAAIARSRSAAQKAKDDELDQDLKELGAEGTARFQFAEQTEREIEEERAKSLAAVGIDPDAPLGLDAPDVPLALPAPQDVDVAPETTIAEDEFANLSFDKAQYERVLQQVKADITSGKPINIPAIQQRVKSDIPGTKVSQVRDIMNELKARGFVAESPASKKNKFIAMGSLAPEVKTPDVSYRRQIDSAADFIKADQTRLERLQYDLRSAEAYGRDLEGNRVTPNQVNATIARVEQRIAENQQRIEASNQRLQSLGQDTHVPRFEKVGLPPGLKAVPVAEGTPDALRPRFEAQQASIRGMKEQLNSVNRQVRKLNDQAKKRTLSSNELDRMQRLQEQQAEVSTRLGEAQANLKTPEKIFQEAKGEQFREQERQREIERKLAAARARAAADQVKAQEDQGVSPVTPAFNAKQTRVFDALKKRLSNLGLKDVKLEGVQKIKGGEGFFDPVTKTITLAMGMYDPNMNDQQLFDAISEVMNHEVIHALRAMGVLKPNEMKVLERLAEKTKYVKRTKEGTQKRNYTYLDRAKSLYSDYTPTQQKEEAIAEMFRDYIAGRLKLGGGPRALFEKIKKFFKALVGTNVDEGFTRVEDIFQGIRRGEIGARDRVAPAVAPAAGPVQSRIPATEEDIRPRQSRLTVPMTAEQRAASIIDYLNPNTGKPLFKKKPGSETLVSFANKLLELRGTRPYNILTSEEDRQAVAQIMAAEAEAALLSSRDALGWYDSTLKLAKQILYPVYPEVSPTRPDGTANPMYEPAAEHAFDYATAVTSNGMAVVDNYQFAAEQYDAWKASTDGKFPVVGKGDQGGSMLKAFEFWNALTDLGYDSNAISELLMAQLPRSEVNNLLKDVFGVRTLKELPAVADTKEEADTIVSVAYVIGPKIGNGFYQNLRGNFDPLTMDRWWMRFVNRITGNPLAIQTEESIASSVDRLWQLVSKPRSLTKMERDILRRAQENLNMTKLEKSDIALLSAEVEKVWNKYFFNKAQNDKLRDLLNEGMDFEIVGGSVRGPDAELAKRLAREARPEKPELALAATNLAKKVNPALEEAPRDARDRTAMRDVANRAREILRRSNQIGADLTNADFQALMWYAEKRIFDAGGVKRGRGEDNDYADGAIAIAKAKGISDAKIEAALPEAERGRVSGVKSQLAGDQDAGGRVGELVREPQEGDFFSPRRLTLVAESDSIEANMTPQERAEVREALQGAEIDPEMPRQMYSRIPVAESYMPTRAPVDSKAGPTPIYGSIMEEGRLLPVVLQKGSHRVYENGVEVGNGLFHIQQRQHDRELIENSKYKRVENAIYDLMRRWQNQGYDDGESVIGYNSRDDLVLEWRNNLAFSAPPMRLVLERGSNVQGAPLADAYYVKTFFPLLERQNRKTQPQRGRALVDEVSADSRRMLSRLYSTTAPSQGTPQFGPSDLETAMQNMRYAGVQDKFASIFKKIGKPFKVDEKAIEDGTQWVVNKLQDNFVSVGKMYDALRKQGANIPRDMDAYFQELLMHGVTGAKKTNFKAEEFTPVVERVARLNVTDTERDALKRVSGYYDQILEKTGNKSHALTNAYLYALHALERNQRISELSKGQITNGSGMSNQEAQNIIAFANSMDAQRAAELRNIAAAVQGMISGTNDTYIEGGLIPDYKDDADVDDKTRQAFTKYKNYVPLRGFADPESDLDVSAGGFSTTNRFGALGSPNKKALGRESYAGDILANVAVQRENAIDKAERNKVGVAVLNLLESDVNTDAYAEVLLRHPLRRVMRNGRITVMPDRDFSNPDLPILAVRRGGEEVLIGFKDPRLAAAFKGTSAKQMNAVMSGLHSFTRLYANMLTSWNPAFLLGNWPKDIETALFNAQQYDMEGSSKDIIKNVRPSFKAIMKVLNNKEGGDPYWLNRYKQFYDNGGQNVLNQMGDVVNNSKDIRDTISKIVAADNAGNRILTKTLWTSTKKGVGSLANYVEAVNSAVENSTRLAFFDAVVRNLEAQGVPTERAVREAAAAARQLTTNFGKGGEMKTAFNTFYLFFNASLQGSMAIFTSLVNNPKGRKLVAGVITAGFIMELLNGAISDDEDDDGIKDYDNLGDYVLSHNIILPDLNGDGTFNRVPLAYGINMFYNFGRVMGNIARGAMGDDGTYTPQEAAASTVGTVVESFNPFGGNNFWTFAAPTQLDLPVELMTNRNFMDGPIYKELSPFEQYKSRSSLYWSTTSPSAVWVSKFINDNIGGGSDIIPGEVLGKRVDIQPDVIEHIIDFMLGGAGKFVIQMGEAATTYAPAAMMGDFEEDMIRRTPIINKFLTAVTERDRSGDFYEKRDDVLAVYADLKDAIDNGDRERALAIRERYAEYLPLIGPIRSINNEIRKLNTLRRNVNANASLSQERKREILDRLEERIAAYVSRGNQLMLSI
jgi:hypothetical protein